MEGPTARIWPSILGLLILISVPLGALKLTNNTETKPYPTYIISLAFLFGVQTAPNYLRSFIAGLFIKSNTTLSKRLDVNEVLHSVQFHSFS
jgi:hypothetical protein